MHHVLRGALGAAFVYPLVWYYSPDVDPVQPPASAAASVSSARGEAQAGGADGLAAEGRAEPALHSRNAPQQRPALAAPEQRARSVSQRLPAAPQPSQPELPHVDNPAMPMPAFAELKETIAQMEQLQEHAHDPKALEERVQSMEQDPQKIAKLKAIAELLVKLPPSRSEGYLPAGEASPARPSR